jgi:hypothetical protein
VAKIDKLTFGSIVVEGKKYRRNILIFTDGTVVAVGDNEYGQCNVAGWTLN